MYATPVGASATRRSQNDDLAARTIQGVFEERKTGELVVITVKAPRWRRH